jgi:hypothetical protein
VIVPVSADGEIDLYNGSPAGSTDLVADVTGYYTTTPNATTAAYVPLDPSRILDTRNDPGPVSANTAVGVNTSGIPDATSYVLNLTAVEATGNGYLTAAPAGAAVSSVSSVNYLQGQTVANLAQVPIGPSSTGQGITITNSEIANGSHTSVEVIVDLFGYYSHV